ncbi:MAG: response regulator transcription factor [Terriglobales bacterium]
MYGVAVVSDWRGGLSARKRQIMEAVCEGLCRKEIAARLGISPETVKQHMQELYVLAGVHSGKELLARLMGQRNEGAPAALLRLPTNRQEFPRAVLALVGQLLPQARVRFVGMGEMPLPARQAVGRGECWTGATFYAPCWLPPSVAALGVRPAPVSAEQIEQLHLLGMVAQARAAWLSSGRPAPALRRPLPQLAPLASEADDLEREYGVAIPPERVRAVPAGGGEESLPPEGQ